MLPRLSQLLSGLVVGTWMSYAVTPSSLAEPGSQPVCVRVSTPPGYKRIAVSERSFGAWLRNLPVRPGCAKIRDYKGRKVPNQDSHYAILDVDIGSEDLQQCADAVIRLRAEYLLSIGCGDEIRFNLTNGDSAFWRDWREGARPVTNGNFTTWHKSARPDASYANFRAYLDVVFTYAGTMSLSRELMPVRDPARPEIGDVYIVGGFPGHAALVIDVAENNEGERIFLLAQGYMPAQDIHVLRSGEDINPWFTARPEGELRIPGSKQVGHVTNASDKPTFVVRWTFSYTDLRRFRSTGCEVSGSPTN